MTGGAGISGHAAVVGAILAGGAARRLGGCAKGLLEIEGNRVIDRVASALRPLTSRLVIVSSDPRAGSWLPGTDVVTDEHPGAGALAGVATALRVAECDVLVVAWDMPFVTSAVLERLLDEDDGYDATMWQTASGIEPLCARYRVSALPIIDAAIASGVSRARDIAALLRVRTLRDLPTGSAVEPFLSINTPEDLALARRMARREDDLVAHPG